MVALLSRSLCIKRVVKFSSSQSIRLFAVTTLRSEIFQHPPRERPRSPGGPERAVTMGAQRPSARGGRSGATIGSRSVIRSALTCRPQDSSPGITALATSSRSGGNPRQQVFRVFPRFRTRASRHGLDCQATVTTIVSLGSTRTRAARSSEPGFVCPGTPDVSDHWSIRVLE